MLIICNISCYPIRLENLSLSISNLVFNIFHMKFNNRTLILEVFNMISGSSEHYVWTAVASVVPPGWCVVCVEWDAAVLRVQKPQTELKAHMLQSLSEWMNEWDVSLINGLQIYWPRLIKKENVKHPELRTDRSYYDV